MLERLIHAASSATRSHAVEREKSGEPLVNSPAIRRASSETVTRAEYRTCARLSKVNANEADRPLSSPETLPQKPKSPGKASKAGTPGAPAAHPRPVSLPSASCISWTPTGSSKTNIPQRPEMSMGVTMEPPPAPAIPVAPPVPEASPPVPAGAPPVADGPPPEPPVALGVPDQSRPRLPTRRDNENQQSNRETAMPSWRRHDRRS